MIARLSSERHWFVLGLFASAVALGFIYFVKNQPQPTLAGKPHEGYGSLIVETDPTGATVEVAGAEFETPVKIEGLTGGSHKLTITKDGFEEAERTVTIRPPGTAEFFVNLTRSR